MKLQKTPIPAGLLKAHLVQEATRKLETLDKSGKASVLFLQDLPVGTEIYYFKNGTKLRIRHYVYARHPYRNIIFLSTTKEHAGPTLKEAYEDV